MNELSKIAVIIPCFRVGNQIESVINKIETKVNRIYCVNDCCPDGTGKILDELSLKDERIVVIHRKKNGGVGAATITGYQAAIVDEMDILVKMDGDGQMDPSMITYIIQPIIDGNADYVKGNRFFNPKSLRGMPKSRIFGNAILSFMTKISTGYWKLFDPSNGFTALHAGVASVLELNKINKRYFFEADILYRLSTVRANIFEIPMDSIYNNEVSQMSELNVALTFPFMHLKNFFKRITYSYFLRGFSLASISLVVGIALSLFGFVFGINAWINTLRYNMPATAGTVMLAALPFWLGIQMLFNFLNFDIANTPDKAIYKNLNTVRVIKPNNMINYD